VTKINKNKIEAALKYFPMSLSNSETDHPSKDLRGKVAGSDRFATNPLHLNATWHIVPDVIITDL
jgi:hypothetical protein